MGVIVIVSSRLLVGGYLLKDLLGPGEPKKGERVLKPKPKLWGLSSDSNSFCGRCC